MMTAGGGGANRNSHPLQKLGCGRALLASCSSVAFHEPSVFRWAPTVAVVKLGRLAPCLTKVTVKLNFRYIFFFF